MARIMEQKDDLIVAREVEELRVLDVVIEGIKIEALADNGSQIISIQRDLWERFQTPLRLDQRMTMKSANKLRMKQLVCSKI